MDRRDRKQLKLTVTVTSDAWKETAKVLGAIAAILAAVGGIIVAIVKASS